MVTYTVLGVVTDPSYYHCESLAKRIAENSSDVRVETFLSFEVEFWERVDEYKNKIDSALMHYRSTHLVLCDQTIIGDVEAFTSYVSSRFDYAVDAEVANTVIYNRNVREGFYNLLKNHENPIVYIQFGLQDTKKVNDYDPMGGVYIELFSKLCPKASENFIKLCEGGKGSNRYTGCTINRLVRNGWLQTGDVVDNTGKNSVAVEGDTVPDECFQVDLGQWRGGVVGYANEGAHTNRSQFFITLGACPWMNHKFVGFGRVIQGYSILRRINDISTNNQVPVRAVKILECGSPPELKA